MDRIYDENAEMDYNHILNDLDTILHEYYNIEWDRAVQKHSESGKGGSKLKIYGLFKMECSGFTVQLHLQIEIRRYSGVKVENH